MESISQQLETFYLGHRQQLFTCAMAVTRCHDSAEDAIQDAFYRLFRLPVPPRNLRAYVFRAVRNAALDQLRRRDNHNAPLNDSIFDDAPSPHDQAVDSEFHQRLNKALLELNEDERETIILHLYSDLAFREIAEVRQIPLGTVTSWYRRGVERLRDRLEKSP